MPLLQPSKTENIINQLNFRYKPELLGYRSRLSVYPGESLISNITIENRHPSSAYINKLKIYQWQAGAGNGNGNDAKLSINNQMMNLIQINPKLDPSVKNFNINYEQTKSIPMNVAVSSIEYLLKIIDEQKNAVENMVKKDQGRNSNAGSAANSNRGGANETTGANETSQSNIIEESTFVLETTYNGSLEECKSFKRTLDLKIMVQIRKGLEPITLLISEFDDEYFKITLTLQNHSKSNEFCIGGLMLNFRTT